MSASPAGPSEVDHGGSRQQLRTSDVLEVRRESKGFAMVTGDVGGALMRAQPVRTELVEVLRELHYPFVAPGAHRTRGGI